MPKKRHQTLYTKPPSIASPTLRITSSRETNEQNERSVNDILADMRRSGQSSTARSHVPTHPTPSLPPTISRILQLPETPTPRPRTRLQQRRALNGRLLPPGPPPPRSWFHNSVSTQFSVIETISGHADRLKLYPLPDAFNPRHGSLIDMSLHQLIVNWGVQKEWNRYYLYDLPDRLRTALICYVSKYHEEGVSIDDLRIILAGPTDEELAEYQLEKPDTTVLNADIHHLDLTGCVGSMISVKMLTDLLFPPVPAASHEIADSWDAPELLPAPTSLLPNLTHLSLAVDSSPTTSPSWKQLLSLSAKLPGLTHLNLSGWPAPSMTPNSTFTTMFTSTGQSVPYGGTHLYSHALDNDWSEAVSVLKRLSKALYNLEYLDLTGCSGWYPALHKEVDAELTIDFVDWSREWGKITFLRLCSGYQNPETVEATAESAAENRFMPLLESKRQASVIEKRIIAQRAGQGRFITVESDTLKDSSWTLGSFNRLDIH
ncbi:hypothetical protein LQW54_012910 [Pestalotiopsis sp. IQ-011]